MKSLLKRLLRSHNQNTPLITVSVSKSALIHNLSEFRNLASKDGADGKIAPVLKSNAYGHGLIVVAEALEKENVPFFIIDSHFEARQLRSEGISKPLLIIGYSATETILENKLGGIRFTITSLDALKELAETADNKVIIHLKIDTGMHRQGILTNEIAEALDLIQSNTNIHLEGICSHFADADNQSPQFTELQITAWNIIVDKVKARFPNLPYWHISATSGHKYTTQISANLTRLGIGLYGIRYGAPVEFLVKIRPALEMSTMISGVKKIKKGDCVGYGCAFIAQNEMTIATIPVGYFEGVDRRLSNKGVVKIGNAIAPMIGRISMNITTIDVTNIPTIKRGDKVVVISNQAGDKNSIENIAKDCDTIPYEIAVHIPAHLKRVLVD